MKNLKIKVFAAAILAVSAVSCDKFLSYESPSSFTQEEMCATEVDMWRAVCGIYASLTSDYLYGEYALYLHTCSDCEYQEASSYYRGTLVDISQKYLTTNNSYLNTIWIYYWKAVYCANDVIQAIEASQLFKESPSTEVLQMHGEAVTLRAWLYYELVRTWGDVPYIREPQIFGDKLAVPVTDRDIILSGVIDDLIAVEPQMLYPSAGSFGSERVSRSFCQGLIARIALLRGGYSLRPDYDDRSSKGTMKRNESDWRKYYEIADTYAGKLIESGQHSLKTSFEQVFLNEMNHIATTGDDVIFEIPFRSDNAAGGRIGYNNGIKIASGSPWGQSLGQFSIPDAFMHYFDPDDQRQFITGCHYKVDSSYKKALDSPAKLGKWNKCKTSLDYGGIARTGVDLPVLRYADVLLMYAETQNELNGGPTGAAVSALKQVRSRAFPAALKSVKVDDYVDALRDHDDFFEAIVRERAFELSGEQIRDTDLARWNIIGSRVRSMIDDWLAMSFSAQVRAGAITGVDKSTVPFQNIPTVLYYKLDEAGEFILEGFNEILPGPPTGFTSWKYLRSQAVWHAETQTYSPSESVLNSYVSWLGIDGNKKADDVVVYILPIPQYTVDLSNGVLSNYYGYNY